VEYTYDVLGRVAAITNGGKISAKYEYNIDNTIAQVLYGSGICARYEYDLDKNITRLLNTDPTGKEMLCTNMPMTEMESDFEGRERKSNGLRL